MRKFLWMLAVSLFILHANSNSFALTKLYETSTKQVINSGTNLTKYKRLTENGWLSVNVMEIDLKG